MSFAGTVSDAHEAWEKRKLVCQVMMTFDLCVHSEKGLLAGCACDQRKVKT